MGCICPKEKKENQSAEVDGVINNNQSNIQDTDRNNPYSNSRPFQRNECGRCRQSFNTENELLQHYEICFGGEGNNSIPVLNNIVSFDVNAVNTPETNPFIPDDLYEYIDWEVETDEESGINTWKNKGVIKLNSSKLSEITKQNASEIFNLKFYEKRAWYNNYINKHIYDKSGDYNTLVISRDKILEESFLQIKTTDNLNLRKSVQIFFIDEIAQDVGGVFREFYSCLFSEIFNPKYNLFIEIQNKYGPTSIFIPHTQPKEIKDSSQAFYNFIGKMLGKGIYDKQVLKVNFNRILLKHLVKQPILLEDIKYLDLQIYESLNFIKQNSVEGLGMPFSWSVKDEEGNLKDVELCRNGLDVLINELNKNEFICKV